MVRERRGVAWRGIKMMGNVGMKRDNDGVNNGVIMSLGAARHKRQWHRGCGIVNGDNGRVASSPAWCLQTMSAWRVGSKWREYQRRRRRRVIKGINGKRE